MKVIMDLLDHSSVQVVLGGVLTILGGILAQININRQEKKKAQETSEIEIIKLLKALHSETQQNILISQTKPDSIGKVLLRTFDTTVFQYNFKLTSDIVAPDLVQLIIKTYDQLSTVNAELQDEKESGVLGTMQQIYSKPSSDLHDLKRQLEVAITSRKCQQ